eukprot:1092237-Rhodomonas_salina.3
MHLPPFMTALVAVHGRLSSVYGCTCCALSRSGADHGRGGTRRVRAAAVPVTQAEMRRCGGGRGRGSHGSGRFKGCQCVKDESECGGWRSAEDDEGRRGPELT